MKRNAYQHLYEKMKCLLCFNSVRSHCEEQITWTMAVGKFLSFIILIILHKVPRTHTNTQSSWLITRSHKSKKHKGCLQHALIFFLISGGLLKREKIFLKPSQIWNHRDISTYTLSVTKPNNSISEQRCIRAVQSFVAMNLHAGHFLFWKGKGMMQDAPTVAFCRICCYGCLS